MATGYATGEVSGSIPDAVAGWIVAALGLLLVGVGVGYYLLIDGAAAFEVAVASLPGTVTTALWAATRRLGTDAEHQPRLLRWTVIGGGLLGGLILVVVSIQGALDAGSVPLLQFMTGVGTAAGVAIGFSEARSVDAARRTERARVSAEHVREERDRLRFLNSLLRHNVLNKANVIRAQTRHVAERQDGEFDEELTTALEQTDEIAELVKNVRHLIEATTDDSPSRPVDLRAAVTAAIDSVESEAGATIETDIPDLRVHGDDLLKYVVENLVRNGLQHHDRADPTVRVSATADGDRVRLRVVDDGPGIPESRHEEVLRAGERGDSGLGLHLVATVIEGYGGSVDIRDNEPRGTVVELTLPRAQDDI
jgi:two-component system OmpR family sensor kinase